MRPLTPTLKNKGEVDVRHCEALGLNLRLSYLFQAEALEGQR